MCWLLFLFSHGSITSLKLRKMNIYVLMNTRARLLGLDWLLTSGETWVSWIVDELRGTSRGRGGLTNQPVHSNTTDEEWPVWLQNWSGESLQGSHCELFLLVVKKYYGNPLEGSSALEERGNLRSISSGALVNFFRYKHAGTRPTGTGGTAKEEKKTGTDE